MSKKPRTKIRNLGDLRVRFRVGTQADFATYLGKSDETFVTNWETGKFGPDLRLIRERMGKTHPDFVAAVEAAVKDEEAKLEPKPAQASPEHKPAESVSTWTDLREGIAKRSEAYLLKACEDGREDGFFELIESLPGQIGDYRGAYQTEVRLWAMDRLAEIHEWGIATRSRLRNQLSELLQYDPGTGLQVALLTLSSELKRRAAIREFGELCCPLVQCKEVLEKRILAVECLIEQSEQVDAELRRGLPAERYFSMTDWFDTWPPNVGLKNWLIGKMASRRFESLLWPAETEITQDYRSICIQKTGNWLWEGIPRELLTQDQYLDLQVIYGGEKFGLACQIAPEGLKPFMRLELVKQMEAMQSGT